jgi:pimeloyl-ACP methyl ester carboxylesterase
VLRCGAGRPLLLLHGPTTIGRQLPFVALLARQVEVIAPSHPGFAGSPRPDDVDSMYDLVRLYEAVLDELPDDQVAVVGFSFGGWIAAELGVTASHRLDRLILVDAVGIKLGGREERDIAHLFNTPPAELQRRAWHDPARHAAGPFGLGWQERLDALDDDDMVRLARNADALCLYAWQPHLYNPHLRRWLHRIRVPTLVLWGASDRIVTPAYGAAFARSIPGATFRTIPGAGHHPELEQPQAFVDELMSFLASA